MRNKRIRVYRGDPKVITIIVRGNHSSDSVAFGCKLDKKLTTRRTIFIISDGNSDFTSSYNATDEKTTFSIKLEDYHTDSIEQKIIYWELISITTGKTLDNGKIVILFDTLSSFDGPLSPQAKEYITGVPLIGPMDGENRYFSFPDSVAQETEIIYYNGVPQFRGDDYLISGRHIKTVSFLPDPTDETLIGDYYKYENNWISGEPLNGDKNGINTSFTYDYEIYPNSEIIFYGKVRQIRDVDYTITHSVDPGGVEIEALTFTPKDGEQLNISCIKK